MMADDLCGIEETYLLMHVEIAHTLGDVMRLALDTKNAFLISRSEEHRLMESIDAIADVTGETPHQVWVQYVGHAFCGPACSCKETA